MLENKIFQPKPGILEDMQSQLLLARKLESVYANRPDIASFVGAMKDSKHAHEYSVVSVQRDRDYVKNTRAAIDEKNHANGQDTLNKIEGGFQLSEILQAMVVDRMNHNWYKECKAVMTSDFDDLKAGIDAVMKHEYGGYLGTSFDFTVTSKDTIVYEKLTREWQKNVVGGNIPTVKYFEDPDTKEKKRLLVPKFIIGASKKDIEELADAYLSNNQEVLNNHPFKYVMLLQIEEQLQTVLDYYDTHTDPALSFAKKQYEQIQNLLRRMKNEIHFDEEVKRIDLYEHSKNSVALDMMRRFRIMRGSD